MTRRLPEGWEDVAEDPDPREDLGYDPYELDVIKSGDGEQPYLLFLPREEDLLADEAFIVAEQDDIVLLEDCR